MSENAQWPDEIRLKKDKNELAVTFNNGRQFCYSAEFLRVHSPSAEVQGHSPDQRKIVGYKANVLIKSIQPVGNYAVRLVFDDGHDTGLYSWSYLYKIGEDYEALWHTYLDELEEKNLARS
jgi:DUF971 family protein